MGRPTLIITQINKKNYFYLLDVRQIILKDSLFYNKLFKETCKII